MAYRTGATELGDARRRVEELVDTLASASASAERSFEHPWELRAFAVALAAYQNGQYEWNEFQLSLIQSIRQWEDGDGGEPWSYYEHWLAALESVLAGHGLVSDAVLDDRARRVLATPRDANHQRAHPEPVAVDPGR